MEIFETLGLQITNMRLSDYIDIIVMAFLLYKVLPMLWHSGAMRIIKAIIVVLLIAWITDVFELYTLNYVVDQVLRVGIIALVILFQPELRRILDHIGNVKLANLFSSERHSQEMESVIRQTVMACEQMSRERWAH
jgi:diadenylate cyclase